MEIVHVARNLFLVSLLNFVMLALSFLDLFLSLFFHSELWPVGIFSVPGGHSGRFYFTFEFDYTVSQIQVLSWFQKWVYIEKNWTLKGVVVECGTWKGSV